MVEYEDCCVMCGLPCLGERCPNMNVPFYYCDKCGRQFSPYETMKFGNKIFCEDCMEEMKEEDEE